MAKYDADWWFGENSFYGQFAPDSLEITHAPSGTSFGFGMTPEEGDTTFIDQMGIPPEMLVGIGALVIVLLLKK
jgi:hypothetical protein